MNSLTTFLESSFQSGWAERVGWTLLHSLWQIAMVAGVYAIAALLLRNRSASARYITGSAAMLAMLVLSMITYIVLPTSEVQLTVASNVSAPAPVMPPVDAAALPAWEGNLESPDVVAIEPAVMDAASSVPVVAPAAQGTLLADVSSFIRPWLPWATAVWLAGVLLLSLRPIWGWLHVRRLQRHGLSPLTDPVRQVCGDVMRRLKVNRAVRFAQSALVEVPTVVGYLRPLVLLPASAITGLSASEIEMILAHELAHVRRHDYLVNLAQTVIEALLFYHPGMWWVSSQIRKERENCCDDIAVALNGSRTSYVRALARLEEQRAITPTAVLAATGGSLLQRVRRLLGQPQREFGYRNATAWLAGLATIGLVAAALLTNGVAQGEQNGSTKDALEKSDFPQATADRVVQVLRSHHMSFMTDQRLKMIHAEFAALVQAHQRDDLSDERKQAILNAIEQYGTAHLRLEHFRPNNHRSLNLAYLNLPDRLKTLQWKLWKAIARAPLSGQQQQRLDDQRRWMLDHVEGLPEYHIFTHADALADLKERLADPLCATLDRPITDEQFADFQARLGKYPRDKALDQVVPHIVQKSLYVQYNDFSDINLPFNDRAYGYGAGRVVHMNYESNRQHRGDNRSLRNIDESRTVVDAVTGYPISAPKDVQAPQQFRKWLDENGQGDFAYDKDRTPECSLMSVRGAKLVLLDVTNWVEADAIPNDELRKLLNKKGQKVIPLQSYYQIHRDQHQTHPSVHYIPPYIGVLTKEGKLSVVAVEEFSGIQSIGYRVRARKENDKKDAIVTPQPVTPTLVDPTFTLPDHRTVRTLRFSPDGTLLVSVARDEGRYLIRIWNVAEKKLTSEVKLDWDESWNRYAGSMILSQDGTKVISSLGGEIGIFDVATGKLVKRLKPPAALQKDAALGGLSCTPDMSRIAGVRTLKYTSAVFQDAHSIVWNVDTGAVLQTILLKAQGYNVRGLSLSADGKRLAVGSGNHASLWNVGNGKRLLEFVNTNPNRKHPDGEVKAATLKRVLSVGLSPDGKLLAIGDMLGVKLVDATSGKILQQIDGPYRYEDPARFIFSSDSQLLARIGTDMTLGTPDTIPVWLTQTGEMIAAITSDANDASFSHDNQQLAIGVSSRDEAIKVYQISEQTSKATEDFVRKFKDGGQVQLLAIGDQETRPHEWWSPYGKQLTDARWNYESRNVYRLGQARIIRTFIVQVNGVEDVNSIKWQLKRQGRIKVDKVLNQDGKPVTGYYAIVVTTNPQFETITLSAQLGEQTVQFADLPLAAKPEETETSTGLEFLKGIPEFANLRLDMTEGELKEVIARQQLVSEIGSSRNGTYTDYRITTPNGKNVIVTFSNGKCAGIQRMRDTEVWGKAVDGLRLGIRRPTSAKPKTRFQHGDPLSYEVWVKNETDQVVHILRHPYRMNYGPSLADGALNIVGSYLKVWFAIPIDLSDTWFLTLGPQKSGLLMHSHCVVHPEGTKPSENNLPPICLAPGKYPCLAEVDLHYLPGGDRQHNRKDGKSVHLKSKSVAIEIVTEDDTALARKAFLPDLDNRPEVLDLASGKMITVVEDDEAIRTLQQGDLGLDSKIAALRGGTISLWNGKTIKKLEAAYEAEVNANIYDLPVPCRILVTTAEGKQFDVNVIKKTEDGGWEIEYRPVGSKHTLRIPGEYEDNGTVRGKVTGVDSLGKPLLFNVMLDPGRERSGWPPFLLVPSGESFEFTNVPTRKYTLNVQPVVQVGMGKNRPITRAIGVAAQFAEVTVKDQETQTADFEFEPLKYPIAEKEKIERDKFRAEYPDADNSGEEPQPIEFHGLKLHQSNSTSKSIELPLLWEEVLPGSSSYEMQKDVEIAYQGLDGTVFYRPDKKVFYVQSDPAGSSRMTYYGPFDGDPMEVLDLPSSEPTVKSPRFTVQRVYANPTPEETAKLSPEQQFEWPPNTDPRFHIRGTPRRYRISQEAPLFTEMDLDDVRVVPVDFEQGKFNVMLVLNKVAQRRHEHWAKQLQTEYTKNRLLHLAMLIDGKPFTGPSALGIPFDPDNLLWIGRFGKSKAEAMAESIRKVIPRRTSANAIDISFADLAFDVQKGEELSLEMVPERIRKLNGEQVRIRGFMMPTQNKTGNKRFVLVRDNQEEFPLPIHDNILVTFNEGKTADFTIRPITVTGRFSVTNKTFTRSGKRLLSIYAIDANTVTAKRNDRHEQIVWGDPVNGVQSRLIPKQIQWPAGTPPEFEIEILNRGSEVLTLPHIDQQLGVEVDGHWYSYGKMPVIAGYIGSAAGSADAQPIGLLHQPLVLDNHWGREWEQKKDSLNKIEISNKDFVAKHPVLQALIPGKHTIRVRVMGELITQPVEIEIVAAEEPAKASRQTSSDYKNILGKWEVVSIKGHGGKLMSLSGNSQPGDLLTIPHVQAPGPDYQGSEKIYQKSPYVRLWHSEEIKNSWARNDSLHLHPEVTPSRLTYKPIQGDQGHFGDQDNPPQFAIYHLEGDELTIVAGAPQDYKLNEGSETTTTSAGTPAYWKWKIVVPNFPTSFEAIDENRQLLVRLKRKGTRANTNANSASSPANSPSAAEEAAIRDVLQKLATSGKRKNYRQLVDLLTDEQAEVMAGLAMQTATLTVAAAQMGGQTTDEQSLEPLKKRIEALFKKFTRENPSPESQAAVKTLAQFTFQGVIGSQLDPTIPAAEKKTMTTEEFTKLLRQSSGMLTDSRAFTVEAFIVNDQLGTKSGTTPVTLNPNEWKIVVQGDRATATVPDDAPTGIDRQTMELRRINGAWRISKMYSALNWPGVVATTKPVENAAVAQATEGPVNTWQDSPVATVETWMQLALAGKDKAAAKLIMPGASNQTDDLRRMAGAKKIRPAEAYANDRAAMVITSPIKSKRGRDGVIVFRLHRFEGQWRIKDIDIEDAEEADAQAEGFMGHPGVAPIKIGTQGNSGKNNGNSTPQIGGSGWLIPKKQIGITHPPQNIRWGEAVEGLCLGVRLLDKEKQKSGYQIGDRMRYEVWIKNTTNETVFIPRDHRQERIASVKGKVINLMEVGAWNSWSVPKEVTDAEELTLPPKTAARLLLRKDNSVLLADKGALTGQAQLPHQDIKPGRFRVHAKTGLWVVVGHSRSGKMIEELTTPSIEVVVTAEASITPKVHDSFSDRMQGEWLRR